MSKRVNLNQVNPDVKYPPRRGWKFSCVSPSRELLHRGYWSSELKPCPCCGLYPVFEESTRAETDVEQRATVFVGICPKCEIRTRKDGTLKEAVIMWQRRAFSRDSYLMNRRPKYDSLEGVRELSQKIVDAAVEDAMMYARERQEAQEGSERFIFLGDRLEELERFFKHSVFMWEMDPDGIISDIRRILYPELEPKDRIKIPLHLSRLYEGKKVIEKCTQKTNS